MAWTQEENKTFEVGLARHFHDAERWNKLGEMLPGKTLLEIIRHFEQLEQDVLHIQNNSLNIPPNSIWSGSSKRVKIDQGEAPFQLASSSPGSLDRRKGVPWTKEEHAKFLLGLSKCGKGSWRSISRQFVFTRTPTQVASHAQKYFLRLNLFKDKREKRRASIHDTTTDHLSGGSVDCH